MKWRTNEEYPNDGELCFCEVLCRGSTAPYVLRFNATNEFWKGPGLGFGLYFVDKVIRWCPVKEIMALLNSENDALADKDN